MSIHLPLHYPFVIRFRNNGKVYEYASASDRPGYMIIAESIPDSYGDLTLTEVLMDDVEIIERWNGKEYIKV